MKKLLVLALSICLVFSLFVGCQKNETNNNETNNNETNDNQKSNVNNDKENQKEDNKSSSDDSSKNSEDNFNGIGEFPIVKEKEEINIFAGVSATMEDINTNAFTTWYEEKTNVHVNWEAVPSSDMKEKVNLVLASGSYPDVLLNAGLTKSQVMLYGSQGVFLPLNERIEKQTVFIPKMYEAAPYIKEGTTAPDGNIYAFPSVSECYHCANQQKMWIYTPWLEALKLDMPTTTDEFKDVLIAFRDNDPNGNGENDEIPLAGAIKGWNTAIEGFLMNPFVYYNNTNIYVEDGEVRLNAWENGWKEGLKYLKDLYDEGLIAPESFTQDDTQLKQLGENPDEAIMGAVPAGWFGVFSINLGESRRFLEYKTIEPLEGPSGLKQTPFFPYGVSQHMVITNECENPDLVVRWADWFYSDEGNIAGYRGVEGISWEYVENQKSYTGDDAVYREGINGHDYGQVQNVRWEGTAINYSNKYTRESAVADIENVEEYSEYILWKETRDNYEPYSVEKSLPDIFYTDEQAAEIATLKPVIEDYIKLMTARFVTGEVDIEDGWDAYVNELEQMGAPRYVEVVQEALDANS